MFWFEPMRTARVPLLVCFMVLARSGTEVHSSQYDLPCQVKAVPELGIMYAKCHCVSPHGRDVLSDIGKCTHTWGR